MSAQPVEWVVVIYYGTSAHRATYGRLGSNGYTKDYIQLLRNKVFLDAVGRLFPTLVSNGGSVPLIYKWPKGEAPGALVLKSADRPHLKWETRLGAPKVWKMSLSPSDSTEETIPGNPNHSDSNAAESELAMLQRRGAGQPYLVAIKLYGEPYTLHLRAYLDSPSAAYAWADLKMTPLPVQQLAIKTSEKSTLAWEIFASGGSVPTAAVKEILSNLESSVSLTTALGDLDAGVGRRVTAYLRHPGYGLFFDPAQNHDAWVVPASLSRNVDAQIGRLLERLNTQYPAIEDGDAVAEAAEPDPKEVEAYQRQIEAEDYRVADSTATMKTRGSAQRAFANAVKSNYGYRCAITGIKTRDFLIASHIVPWSEDQSIRLDPSNGICLSVLMDRAFEKGHLLIDDDLSIRINWTKVGNDLALRRYLEPYDGKKVMEPRGGTAHPAYLERRRALVALAV
jgi:hypothetical protein